MSMPVYGAPIEDGGLPDAASESPDEAGQSLPVYGIAPEEDAGAGVPIYGIAPDEN